MVSEISHDQLCQPNGSVNDECVAEVLSHPRCFNSSETNTVTLSRSTVSEKAARSTVSESTNDHSSGIDDVASLIYLTTYRYCFVLQ